MGNGSSVVSLRNLPNHSTFIFHHHHPYHGNRHYHHHYHQRESSTGNGSSMVSRRHLPEHLERICRFFSPRLLRIQPWIIIIIIIIMMVYLVLRYLANIASPKWQVFCTLLKAVHQDTFKNWRSSPKWFSVNRHHHHHHCAFNITAGEPNDVSTVGCSPEIQLSVFTWNPFSASVDLAPNQRDTE